MAYKEVALGNERTVLLTFTPGHDKLTLEVYDPDDGCVSVAMKPGQATDLASLLLQFSSQAHRP